MEARAIDPRFQRGLALAKTKGSNIRPIVGAKYLVPSAAERGGYVVDVAEKTCTCPDWQELGGHGRTHRCKHVYAVLVIRHEIALPDGSALVTEEKVFYPRDYRAESLAGVDLYKLGPALLSDLVSGVPLSSLQGRRRGRPRAERRDVLHAIILREFEERTCREAVEAMEASANAGLWNGRKLPHFNTFLEALQDRELTPILQDLVNESARPLVTIERMFAVDASSFSTSRYDSWERAKFGGIPAKKTKRQRWVKVHACVGTSTHIITAIQVTENTVGDAPMLPELVLRTHRNGYIMDKVTADAAYLSTNNISAIDGVGANAFIAFKSNSTGGASPVLGKLFHKFITERDTYEQEYHSRSNVETVFSMMKTRFGGYVRSRKPVAQYNELMAKALCHNIACLVKHIHLLHIEPKFWTPSPMEVPILGGDGGANDVVRVRVQ